MNKKRRKKWISAFLWCCCCCCCCWNSIQFHWFFNRQLKRINGFVLYNCDPFRINWEEKQKSKQNECTNVWRNDDMLQYSILNHSKVTKQIQCIYNTHAKHSLIQYTKCVLYTLQILIYWRQLSGVIIILSHFTNQSELTQFSLKEKVDFFLFIDICLCVFFRN